MTNDDSTTDQAQAQAQTPVLILTNAARFQLGQIVATPGALKLLEKTGFSAAALIGRHVHGDDGDLCAEDAELNRHALIDGSRIMSVYRLVDAAKLMAIPKSKRSDLPTIWIITDATNEDGQREVTTLLLPSDY
jgi:hypothetical protein